MTRAVLGGRDPIRGADGRKRRGGQRRLRRPCWRLRTGLRPADDTPAPILAQIVAFGGDLVLLEGHIGDCGKAARAWAQETGAIDMSTLKEPYRIEGKKTLGLEIAEQLGWRFPDVILYPTGGGTGLIGMWKAFVELRDAGWVAGPLPRMYSVQSTGCAPSSGRSRQGQDSAEAVDRPLDHRQRAPGSRSARRQADAADPSGDRWRGGGCARRGHGAGGGGATGLEGVDFSPEGGAAVAAASALVRKGEIGARDQVVVFNTGAGWLYRGPAELPDEGR